FTVPWVLQQGNTWSTYLAGGQSGDSINTYPYSGIQDTEQLTYFSQSSQVSSAVQPQYQKNASQTGIYTFTWDLNANHGRNSAHVSASAWAEDSGGQQHYVQLVGYTGTSGS